MKLVNGLGEVVECVPSDDSFKAAIGGIGSTGIITEVELQCVKRFNISQEVVIVDKEDVRASLRDMLENNDHASIYMFPLSHTWQLNTWNATTNRPSFLGEVREYISICVDALVASWLLHTLAHTKSLAPASRLFFLKRGSSLVLESYKGFNPDFRFKTPKLTLY